jgi:hypothetical protein
VIRSLMLSEMEYQAVCAALEGPPSHRHIRFLVEHCGIPSEYAVLYTRAEITAEAHRILDESRRTRRHRQPLIRYGRTIPNSIDVLG